MCGIAGIYYWNDAQRDESAAVERMTQAVARRGPDGAGVTTNSGCALGHRRLSIIDLTPRGAQPMANDAGDIQIVFNGEIYNYRELQKNLAHAGYVFRSDSDTEVLLKQYERYADDLAQFLTDVRGMFAFAIWDARRRRLLLARDRLGIKPLVYFRGAEFIAFASDLDALTAYTEVPRRLDWTSLYDYLTLLSVPAPHTIFRDVRCLLPGQMLVVENGNTRALTYWQLENALREPLRVASQTDEELESLLTEAVRLHLIADVEIGAFLSGGVDSSLITALATEQNPTRKLQTFSASFPNTKVDEGHFAQTTAQKLDTKHTEFAVESGFLDDLEAVVKALDQPLATASAVSLFQLSRMARGKVKAVLTGDGGDEVFGGYSRHRPYPAPLRAVAWMPPGTRPVVGKLGVAALPAWARKHSSALQKAHGIAALLARDEAALYVPRLYAWQPPEVSSLFPPEMLAQIDAERYLARVRGLLARCPVADQLTRMLFVDLHTTLADEMLTKVDRMTMAHGLEARVPLLDHRLVEWALRLPGAFKRQGDTGKLPLRRLLAPRLGRATAERGKYGFNAPLDDWLRDDAATRARFNDLWQRVAATRAFDQTQLKHVHESFTARRGVSATNLYTLLVFGVWAEMRGVEAH